MLQINIANKCHRAIIVFTRIRCLHAIFRTLWYQKKAEASLLPIQAGYRNIDRTMVSGCEIPSFTFHSELHGKSEAVPVFNRYEI